MIKSNLPQNNDRAREYLTAQVDCLNEIRELISEHKITETYQLEGLLSNMEDEIKEELD